ncbi:hypothetical protein MUP01_12395 [Candidatus Bathyarchaeota archaeon]|nr:hypothetical protein [Candidatus Bathyarchaeota archaeon]
MKAFDTEKAFRKKSDYAADVMRADASRIAGLVKIAGFLLQTKVYLFWRKEN